MAKPRTVGIRFAVFLTMQCLSPLSAQDSTISGQVSGFRQEALTHSTVLILRCDGQICQDQQFERSVHPATDGDFKVGGLESGWFLVLALHPGLQPWSTLPFRLEPGQEAQVEIELAKASRHPVIRYPEATAHQLERFDKILGILGEPPFCAGVTSSEGESYRFLWQRSFHHTILIKLRISDGMTATAIYKETDGNWGDESARLVTDETIDVNLLLTKSGTDAALARMMVGNVSDQSQDIFWNLPFDRVGDQVIGVDGAVWTVEGRRDGKCHVVSRWAPDRSEALRQFADSLISLTGKRFYYDEYY